MKLFFAGLAAAAFVAGCAGHSTVPTNPTIANPGSGNNPNVGQPGSPSPRWSLVTPTSIFQPEHPVLGADNNIWFTGELSFQHIEFGSVTPHGVVSAFPVSPVGAVITATTRGQDGNIWFTLVRFNQGPTYIAVGNITPEGIVTQYPLPTKQTLDLLGIAYGPDGNLWITRQSQLGIDDEIDKMTTSGVETRYRIGQSKLPWNIVVGSDGAMWFAETTGNAIGRISTTGSVSEFALPAGLITPIDMVLAGDGNVWFTYDDQSTNFKSIGRITPSGSITTYPNPQPETEIDGLTVGPDGDLWFTESMGDIHHNTWQLRRITLNGKYDTVDRVIPLISPFTGGLGLATGADGNIWVSESNHQSRFAVYTWRKMTVAPSSVTVGVGQTESITTSETNYSGGWTAASSKRSIATVTPGQQSGTFVVHGRAAGSCQVTVSDSVGNFYVEPVTVK